MDILIPRNSSTEDTNSLENGINTFDTADVYSNGQSEVILGNALKQLNVPREDVVIMTKASRSLLDSRALKA